MKYPHQYASKPWLVVALVCAPVFGCSLLIDSETLSAGKPELTTGTSGSAGSGAAAITNAGYNNTADGGTSNDNPNLLGGAGGSDSEPRSQAGSGGVPAPSAGAGGTSGSAGAAGTHNGTGGQTFVYAANQMFHMIGQAEEGGWAAAVSTKSAPGFLVYGPDPYPTDWRGAEAMVTFHLMVDDNNADDRTVATIHLVDVDLGVPLLSKDIKRSEFKDPNTYQAFSLPWVSLSGRQGHQMDSQVYWHNVAYVRFEKAVVITR